MDRDCKSDTKQENLGDWQFEELGTISIGECDKGYTRGKRGIRGSKASLSVKMQNFQMVCMKLNVLPTQH